MPDGEPQQSRTRNTILNLTLAAIGALLLVFTIRQVGWTEVQGSIRSIGWWFVPIIALGGFRFAARSRAWMACAQHAALRFRDAFAAVLAGDALGNLTPLGLLASEPAKVYFVRARVPSVAAISSLAAENAFYMASVLLMIGAGALVFFSVAELPAMLRLGAQLILAGVMLAGIAAAWIARTRPAILSRLASALSSLKGTKRESVEGLRDIEQRFYGLLAWPGARLAHVAAWEAAFHVAAVAEVFLVLQLVPPPHATLLDAFILETTGRLIVVAFKFIPYRLGVDEAGTALVASALSLHPATGVTLAIVRRVRVLCWNAIGVVLLALRRA